MFQVPNLIFIVLLCCFLFFFHPADSIFCVWMILILPLWVIIPTSGWLAWWRGCLLPPGKAVLYGEGEASHFLLHLSFWLFCQFSFPAARTHSSGITWVYIVSAKAPLIPLVKESKLIHPKPYIYMLIKSRRMGWVCRVTLLGNLGSAYGILWHEKGRDHLEGILVGRKIMSWIWKNWS
jgi:hypothetical protein